MIAKGRHTVSGPGTFLRFAIAALALLRASSAAGPVSPEGRFSFQRTICTTSEYCQHLPDFFLQSRCAAHSLPMVVLLCVCDGSEQMRVDQTLMTTGHAISSVRHGQGGNSAILLEYCENVCCCMLNTLSRSLHRIPKHLYKAKMSSDAPGKLTLYYGRRVRTDRQFLWDVLVEVVCTTLTT